MTVISLSVDGQLLSRFDNILQSEGFSNRSEAFRSAMREFIHLYEQPQPLEDKPVERIIVFSYHDSKQMRAKLSAVQHDYRDMIKEIMHRHIFEDVCFEMFTVKGVKKETDQLVGVIRAIRGIETFHTFSVYLEKHHHD